MMLEYIDRVRLTTYPARRLDGWERSHTRGTVYLHCANCRCDSVLGSIEGSRGSWKAKVSKSRGGWASRLIRRGRTPVRFRTQAEAVQAIIDHHELPKYIPRTTSRYSY
jgi:hypothetical protein